MANKTLNITNNGTGTLTLGGVTIGNSSIATYNSSNKKISIVGAGTTNAAINLNYIKGSVSKNFNRNFNILGKEDANATFRNKVKALMEEYKYAVVSGGLVVDKMTATISKGTYSSFTKLSTEALSANVDYFAASETSRDEEACTLLSYDAVNNYTNSFIVLLNEYPYSDSISSDGLCLKYFLSTSIILKSVVVNWSAWEDDTNMSSSTMEGGSWVLDNTTLNINTEIIGNYYLDFFYNDRPTSYKKYSSPKTTAALSIIRSVGTFYKKTGKSSWPTYYYNTYETIGTTKIYYVYNSVTLKNKFGKELTTTLLDSLYV